MPLTTLKVKKVGAGGGSNPNCLNPSGSAAKDFSYKVIFLCKYIICVIEGQRTFQKHNI